ncbi:hypothetical protein ATANTOWER_005999 [Ataeniobius toweri]|uniref:Uncharacterized protein n=1 Tax=Ataeniobius toweri TaxID=208326 RepID=A0ABU7C0S6_9TELE|nr:hypothetical protein [Ataeniobius toweri]
MLDIQAVIVAPTSSVALSRLDRWVRSGLQMLQLDQQNRCLRMSSMSEADCRRLTHLPLSSVAVYMSEQRTTAASDRSRYQSCSHSRLVLKAEGTHIDLLGNACLFPP